MTDKPSPAKSSKFTVEDFTTTLNGYDEERIERDWGAPLEELLDTRPFKGLRALVQTLKIRDGIDDAEAKKAAMSLTVAELDGFFAADNEVNEDEPVTPEGKAG